MTLITAGGMSGRGISDGVRCVLCETRIASGNGIVGDTPGAFHADCWLRVSRATLALRRILHSAPSGAICHACLAGRLKIDQRLARTAAWRLRANPQFRVRLAQCTDCGVRRITIRARKATVAGTPSAAAGDTGTALAAFGIQVDHRICLALAGPGVLDPTALAVLAGAFLDRRARRVYVLDLDGVELDTAMRSDPRVVTVAPVAPVGDLPGLPERPSLAAVDLRFGAVKDHLPPVLGLLDRRGEAVVRVRLDSLFGLSVDVDRAYSGIRCRVAIVGAARAASVSGWHVVGVVPGSRLGPAAAAFFLHLTAERREAKGLDTMIGETVDALA